MATLWGISDLHLSHARPETRERYAARWRDHAARIAEAWRAVVQRQDLVLLPGDLSMARGHRDVQPDLAWLGRLPGTKLLAPGNHDHWFNQVDAVRRLLRPTTLAVEGDCLRSHGRLFCGARSVGEPTQVTAATSRAGEEVQRSLASLQRALDQATSQRAEGEELWVLWHHPPFDRWGQPLPVVALLREAAVTACVYGHLHTEAQWASAMQGVHEGVRFHCVAADAIGFRPLRLVSDPEDASPQG